MKEREVDRGQEKENGKIAFSIFYFAMFYILADIFSTFSLVLGSEIFLVPLNNSDITISGEHLPILRGGRKLCEN